MFSATKSYLLAAGMESADITAQQLPAKPESCFPSTIACAAKLHGRRPKGENRDFPLWKPPLRDVKREPLITANKFDSTR
ncbi:MAG: hypothetical protein CMF50_08205 [Legionellales bacterium]|nr:hypothetical protein [Legionellales bacterium]